MRSDRLSIGLASMLIWGSASLSLAAEATLTSIQARGPRYVSEFTGNTGQYEAIGRIYNGSASFQPPLFLTTGTFAPTERLSARSYARNGDATATNLDNDTTLIAGGGSTAADLYDTRSEVWRTTGPMTTARRSASATLLSTGRVLIAGGLAGTAGLASAELYDPATETFSLTGSLAANRFGHTATRLGTGEVLIVGGQSTSMVNGVLTTVDIATSELYDPATGTFLPADALAQSRSGHTATLLDNGTVLIAGGVNAAAGALDSAELYDPATREFTAVPAMTRRMVSHTATLLRNGRVLIAGGDDGVSTIGTSQAELYDPVANLFTAIPTPLTAPRTGHAAVRLANGDVLITGGADSTGDLNTAEVYDPALNTFRATGQMTTRRVHHTATALAHGLVLVAGGAISARTAEFYTMGVTWSSTNPRLATVDPVTGVATLAEVVMPDDMTAIIGTSGTVSGGAPLYSSEPLPDLAVSVDESLDENPPTVTVARGSELWLATSHSSFGGGGWFRTALYLSTDATITTADTFVGYITLLPPPETYPSRQSVGGTVPRKLAPGLYYQGVIADYRNEIQEYDETNNTDVSTRRVLVQ